jgi:hypothetical protein
VFARFVGAVRPFVPAIAGMLRMPLRRYVPVSLFAGGGVGRGCSWPRAGIFGKSYDAVAARRPIAWPSSWSPCSFALAVVWTAVLFTWRWFAGHAEGLLERRPALDARASAPGTLRRRADRSQASGIRVAVVARRFACW